MLTLS